MIGPNNRRYALIVSSNNTNRITISFVGDAVLDQGITIPAGGSPLILLYDHFGQAIREEIRVIAAAAATTFGVLDVFEVDCPCTEASKLPEPKPTGY